ncbi:MAG: hypothetical protein LBV12_04900 [Puniceicoccales bacterium]|jgi:hypothetical protein|nr:hypothetical protein [Puniceicoccales bacterium]
MLLELKNQKEPLTLKGPQLFVDFRNIVQGEVDWMLEGKKVSQWGGAKKPQPYPNSAYGIHLEAVQAELMGPMLPQDKPWEQGYLMYLNNIMLEDGKYRMWYTVVPDDFRYREGMSYNHDVGWVLCYAESKDGVNWVKPELGIMQFEGQDTNWVYGREINRNFFSSGCIFKDENPNCPPAEKYKLIYRGEEQHEDIDAWRNRQIERFNGDCDPKALRGKPGKMGTCAVTSGAVSSDGIHWTPIKDPVMMYCSDQMNVCFWDDSIKKYVGYFRMLRAGRRSVGRSETEDFRKWPTPYPCLEVPLTTHPSDDIMHCPTLKYPGTEDLYVMLATMFRRNSDCRDMQLAVSADGLYWNWLPGKPAATREQGGKWVFDEVEVGYNFVPLQDGRIGVPIVTYKYPYKYPRSLTEGDRTPPLGEAGYAVFKPGRLCCVSAPDRGEFSTRCFTMTGKEISLNYSTFGHAGYIEAELQDKKGKTIAEYSFADFKRINGDECDVRLAWNNSSDLSVLAEQSIRLCLRMHMSKVYAFEIK